MIEYILVGVLAGGAGVLAGMMAAACWLRRQKS